MDIFREIDLICWTISITITFFFAFYTYMKLRYKEMDDDVIKKNITTWIWFFICTGIGNFFGVFNRLFIQAGQFGWEMYILVDTISVTFDLTGILIKINYLEKTMKLFKRNYFSFIILFAIILNIVVWGGSKSGGPFQLILLSLQVLGVIILPLLYIQIARTSTGKFRTDALRILFGFLIIEIALSLQAHNIAFYFPNFSSDFLKIFGFPFQMINPLCVAIGFTLIYFGYQESLK